MTCRNRIINRQIREHQASIEYWEHYLKAYNHVTREHASESIRIKTNAIRRLQKLKR